MISTFPFVESCTPYSISLPPGKYKFEAWGGAGGGGELAGKGGYSSGEIRLKEKTKVFVYVGGMGENGQKARTNAKGGCNGGGKGGMTGDTSCFSGSGGGGATDFRLSTSYKDRILVAGGGGGGMSGINIVAGFGGGLEAGNSSYIYSNEVSLGGTQTFGTENGVGENGRDSNAHYIVGAEGNGGCGGGYRGGKTTTKIGEYTAASGSGGSSYVSGHPKCVKYKGYAFQNIQIKSGLKTNHLDNGFAQITYIGAVEHTIYINRINRFFVCLTTQMIS